MENGDQESAYEKTIKDPAPMDPEKAAVRLKEVKRLFDQEWSFGSVRAPV